MSARKLPEPIKPRALRRKKHPIHGFDYFTSDGRYEVYPIYKDRRYGGRSSVVDSWGIRDLRSDEKSAQYYPRLEDVREYYCAPDGKVPWLVCDMDDGIVRVEPSRAAAVKWACSRQLSNRIISRKRTGEGWYDYRIGDSPDDSAEVWIARSDVVHWHGFDPVQEPWYPYPDVRFELGPRALRAMVERAA